MMNKKLFLALFGAMAITSAASAYTTHTIQTGDTLWALSAKHYGDPTLYTILLEVNHISNPRTILNGTVIIIPDKSAMYEIQKESDSSKRESLIAQATGGKSSSEDNSKDKSKEGNKGSKKNIPLTEDDGTFENVFNATIDKDDLKSVTVEVDDNY